MKFIIAIAFTLSSIIAAQAADKIDVKAEITTKLAQAVDHGKPADVAAYAAALASLEQAKLFSDIDVAQEANATITRQLMPQVRVLVPSLKLMAEYAIDDNKALAPSVRDVLKRLLSGDGEKTMAAVGDIRAAVEQQRLFDAGKRD